MNRAIDDEMDMDDSRRSVAQEMQLPPGWEYDFRPPYATAYYVNFVTGEETQCKREMFVRHYTKEVGFKTRESREWSLAD